MEAGAELNASGSSGVPALSDKSGQLGTWGRLLRVPNLFTVPGDPIAGYLLASGGIASWRMAWAAAVSLCLYAAGLLLNDYFDREVDAGERPERPIPSGAVRPATVLLAGMALLVGGVGLAFILGHAGVGAVAAAVALAVLAYDAGLKRVPWLGQVVMGSCRAGSLVVGATFACAPMAPGVVVAAATAWAYTTAVTLLAAGEMKERPLKFEAFVPAGILWVAAAALVEGIAGGRARGVPALVVLAAGIAEAGVSAERVRRGLTPTPRFIGRLIRVMITVQAAWCLWALAGAGAWPWALAIIVAGAALRAGGGLTVRRFYGS